MQANISFFGDPELFGFECELHNKNDRFIGGGSVGGDGGPLLMGHTLKINGGTFAAAGETQTIRLKWQFGLAAQTIIGGTTARRLALLSISCWSSRSLPPSSSRCTRLRVRGKQASS